MQKGTLISTTNGAAAKQAANPEFRKKTEFENKKMDIAFKLYKLD